MSSNTKIKQLAHCVQERNPGMNYTTARNLVLAGPGLPNPFKGNLLVCGSAGSGCTVALRYYASRAVDEGYRMKYISVKEEPLSPWLQEHNEAKNQPYNNPYTGWVNVLDTQPGTKERPLLLIIDNAEYLIDPEPNMQNNEVYFEFRYFLLRLIRQEPYTCVALRMQRPRSEVFTTLWFLNMMTAVQIGRCDRVQRVFLGIDDAPINRGSHDATIINRASGVRINQLVYPVDPAVQQLDF